MWLRVDGVSGAREQKQRDRHSHLTRPQTRLSPKSFHCPKKIDGSRLDSIEFYVVVFPLLWVSWLSLHQLRKLIANGIKYQLHLAPLVSLFHGWHSSSASFPKVSLSHKLDKTFIKYSSSCKKSGPGRDFI